MAGSIGRKNVWIINSPELERAKLRSWREPAEQEGRDRRPGLYSVTGDFIELPEQDEGNRSAGEQRSA
jgi:hypothetical protein